MYTYICVGICVCMSFASPLAPNGHSGDSCLPNPYNALYIAHPHISLCFSLFIQWKSGRRHSYVGESFRFLLGFTTWWKYTGYAGYQHNSCALCKFHHASSLQCSPMRFDGSAHTRKSQGDLGGLLPLFHIISDAWHPWCFAGKSIFVVSRSHAFRM